MYDRASVACQFTLRTYDIFPPTVVHYAPVGTAALEDEGGGNLYSSIYRFLRYRFWRGGKEIRQHLRLLEHTQWLSSEELKERKFRWVQALIRHAYEQVPFYRSRYQEAGIHPESIRSWDDFQKLPFLSKDDIRKNLSSLVDPDMLPDVYLKYTGGSTGEPMRFYKAWGSQWWSAALQVRSRAWYGIEDGVRNVYVKDDVPSISEWTWRRRLVERLKRNRYLLPYSLTEQDLASFTARLEKWKPKVITGYPSALALLARFVNDRGSTTLDAGLVETISEKLNPSQRADIAQAFNAPVAETYASEEFNFITYQCPLGGHHICEPNCLEIIREGKPVPEGELGEIVITALHQYGMPFIRYRIEDAAALAPDPCPCGRGMARLREISGRLNDFIVLSDSRLVHPFFFADVFQYFPQVSKYQIYQPERDRLMVRLICRDDDRSGWLDDLVAQLRVKLGRDISIEPIKVAEIPQTPRGKHRHVISDVQFESFSSGAGG